MGVCARAQGRRVLLAEDNLINQTVAKKMLTVLGLVCEVGALALPIFWLLPVPPRWGTAGGPQRQARSCLVRQVGCPHVQPASMQLGTEAGWSGRSLSHDACIGGMHQVRVCLPADVAACSASARWRATGRRRWTWRAGERRTGAPLTWCSWTWPCPS